jgi:hypothetical protein
VRACQLRRDVDPASVRVELTSLNWLFFRDGDDFDESFARLVDALETDLDWRDTHTRLLKRAREWDAGGRDKSFLLRGRDLDTAEAWLSVQAEHTESATPMQIEYIVASRQSSTRRQRITLGAVATALAVSSATHTGGLARPQPRRAPLRPCSVQTGRGRSSSAPTAARSRGQHRHRRASSRPAEGRRPGIRSRRRSHRTDEA